MKRVQNSILVSGLLFVAAGVALAQTPATLNYLADGVGNPIAPVPGPDDQYQLDTPAANQNPPGLNYYFDNSSPPGQTFTTGSNPDGYILSSLSVFDADDSAGSLPVAGQAYLLRIYAVTGSNAMLYTSYISSDNVTAYDFYWLQWTNLGAPLLPNTQYAYTFGRVPSGSGWANLGNTNGNPYPGGQVVLIPPLGGAMTFSSSNGYDASFDVGLTPATVVTVGTPLISPALAVTNGTPLTITAQAAGPGPLYYQWQTDGGSGGAMTNIPGATSATLAVDTTSFPVAVYQYDVVVSNSASKVTSPVVRWSIVQPTFGASLTDTGSSVASGPYDINQFTGGGSGDGLNYYDDNGANNGYYVGQTFTTGTNSQGYYLTSVALESGGGGSQGTTVLQPYDLFIYQVNGVTASLLAHYTNGSFAFTYGDWLLWSEFPNPLRLLPNTTYTYGFGRASSGTGWAGMNNSPTNTDLYPDGQLCLVPTQGGTMTFGQSGNADAVFNVGLQPIGVGPSPFPFAQPISMSPSPQVTAGTQVTVTEFTTNGSPPLHYQWRTDGGSGGTLTNILGSDTTNLLVDTTGWKPGSYRYDVIVNNNYGSSTSVVSTLTVLYASTTATLTDIGTTVPTPVSMDISQLIPATGPGSPPGFNYYFDNATPPGQTFTTGSNPSGYTLSTVAINMAGNSGNLPAAGQAYLLRIYSVSGGNATLYASYTSQPDFVIVNSAGWLRWSGFALPLEPNSTYAYTFARSSSGSGWDNLANVSGDPYTDGEAVEILPSGGAINYSSDSSYDAVFVLGLGLTGYPVVSPPTFSPASPVYAGTPVGVTADVTGDGPFTYQWQTDGGSGIYTNIPDATNATLTVDTTSLGGLTIGYDLIAANASGMTTGEVSQLTVNPSSVPFITQDITPSAPSLFVGRTVTFSASFGGTLPITYQWQVDKGTGLTNIVGQTNRTLTLANVALSDAGSYILVASNSIGTGYSSVATLTVETPSSAYENAILAGNPLAYYPLNEPDGSLVVHDMYGGHDGTNGGAAIFGVPGVPNPPFLGFSPTNTALQTTNVANSWVSAPFGTLGLSNVTFTAWIYPMGSQPNWAGLIMTRNGGAEGGLGYNDQQMLAYSWNNNSTWSYVSGLVIPSNEWSFVAMVIEPTKATLYLYNTNGLLSAINAIPHTPDVFGDNWRIGNDAQGDPGREFNGVIDNVAIYGSSLTPTQIQDLYATAVTGVAPVRLDIQRSGGSVVLSWPSGILLQANSLAGPWTTNTATSPYTLTPTGTQMFFRVKVQ